MPDAEALAHSCHVCAGPLIGDTATCGNCHRSFHLRMRENDAGRDCGQVWINEQYLSLEFACDVCLGNQPAGSEPPVGHSH